MRGSIQSKIGSRHRPCSAAAPISSRWMLTGIGTGSKGNRGSPGVGRVSLPVGPAEESALPSPQQRGIFWWGLIQPAGSKERSRYTTEEICNLRTSGTSFIFTAWSDLLDYGLVGRLINSEIDSGFNRLKEIEHIPEKSEYQNPKSETIPKSECSNFKTNRLLVHNCCSFRSLVF